MHKVFVVAVVFLVGLSSRGWSLEGDTNKFAPFLDFNETRLERQGVGRMRRFFITGCDVALYTQPGTTYEALFDGAPKALSFYYYVKISGEQFAKAADVTLRENIDDATYQRFAGSIAAMNGLYRDVESGDRYLLYYLPGKGTVLELNGKEVGRVPGDDFADVYFRIWLGDKPVDEKMNKAVLESLK